MVRSAGRWRCRSCSGPSDPRGRSTRPCGKTTGVRGAPESPAARKFGGGACSPAGGWNAIHRWRRPESGAQDSRSFRSPKRRCCGPGPELGGTEVASLRLRRGSMWRSRGVWAELGFGRRCGAIDDAGGVRWAVYRGPRPGLEGRRLRPGSVPRGESGSSTDPR